MNKLQLIAQFVCCTFFFVQAQYATLDNPLFTNGIQQVWSGDNMLYEKFFGFQNKEYEIPITRNTQFRIGSNSKTFATIAIFQLADKGNFNVDDDIALHLTAADLTSWGYIGGPPYCPKFNGSNTCEKITFLHLMAMRTGMVNALGCFQYQPGSWQTQYCVTDDYFTFYEGSIGASIKGFINVPQEAVPGTKYNYNNGNTILLSYFIEKFSGLNIEQYMKTYLFEPFGFENTFYDALNRELEMRPMAVSEYYDYTDLKINNIPFATGNAGQTEVQPGVQSAAGGFFMSAGDLARWYTAMFVKENSTSIITQAHLDEMVQPISFTGAYSPELGCEYFGLGFFMIYKPNTQGHCTISDVKNRNYIYYQGVVQASTCTVLILDNWQDTTKRVVSVAARNNAIMDVTQANYNAAKASKTGNIASIFKTWRKESDSWFPAWNAALYFQEKGLVPYPTSTIVCPTTSSSSQDENIVDLTAGDIAAIVIVPTIVIIGTLIAYLHLFLVPMVTSTGTKNRDTQMSPMAPP